MTLLPTDKNNCPYLFLAPMEGVGDRQFRKAMASVGGFDESVTEFLRVSKDANVKKLARFYDPEETAPIPLAAQIMGSDANLMAAMAHELEKRGAPRIDINCGCPSNTVTGRNAGSSLLKDPKQLFLMGEKVVRAVKIPVTIKMRSGFLDTSLFLENLHAAEASGAKFIALHPRTKAEGYKPPANWDLITQAKEKVAIPVVGNGDILNVNDALNMLEKTKCDALMIGRGAIMNPFIFHQIRCHFAKKEFVVTFEKIFSYVNNFAQKFSEIRNEKFKINKMKQLLGFVFRNNEKLFSCRQEILRTQCEELKKFLDISLNVLEKNWIEKK